MRSIILLAVILVGYAGTASSSSPPVPSEWQSNGSLSISTNTPTDLSVINAQGTAMTNEILAIGLASSDVCGEVQVFAISEDNPTPGNTPDWVLRPNVNVGENIDCRGLGTRANFFGSTVRIANDLLIIGDLNRPGLPDGLGNRVYIYEAVRTNGEIDDWTLLQILNGDDLDLSRFGAQIMSNGDQVLVSGFANDNNLLLADISLFIFSRNQVGQFEVVNQLDMESQFTNFELAGDQVVVSSDPILQFYNYDTSENTLNLAQEITQRNLSLIQVSGDYLVGIWNERAFINRGTLNAAIYKRGTTDQWSLVQNIQSPNGPIIFPFPARDVSLDLQGRDLILNWVDAFSTATLSTHYRLNENGFFQAVQNILGVTSESNNGLINRVVSNGEQLTMIREVRSSQALDLQFFSREQGTHFLINRGISGGWWFGPERGGQGFFLEMLDRAGIPFVLMHWNTHDNNGNQQWLRGVGKVEFDRVTMDIIRPVGGEFGPNFDPATVNFEQWGQVELIFDGCDQGILRYSNDEFGDSELPMLRLTSIDGLRCGDALASETASRWTGSWSDPTHNGEGFLLQVVSTNNNPVMTSIWNTYESNGTQAWLYANQSVEPLFNLFTPGSVIQPKGLTFNIGTNINPPTLEPWGNYIMRRTSCSSIQLEYDSLIASFSSGTQNLQRITTPIGIVCAE